MTAGAVGIGGRIARVGFAGEILGPFLAIAERLREGQTLAIRLAARPERLWAGRRSRSIEAQRAVARDLVQDGRHRVVPEHPSQYGIRMIAQLEGGGPAAVAVAREPVALGEDPGLGLLEDKGRAGIRRGPSLAGEFRRPLV